MKKLGLLYWCDQTLKLNRMKLEIKIAPTDGEKLNKFLRAEAKGHYEAECEFPGYSIEAHWLHPGHWFVVARVGSSTCDLDDSTVTPSKALDPNAGEHLN